MMDSRRNTAPALAIAIFTFALAGCGGERPVPDVAPMTLVQPSVPQDTPVIFTQCVPYAREVSGVQIFGDAWTWWKQANGRYAKGNMPEPGAVLTLRKTKRLPLGHVAVVAKVMDSRKILVDHANWGDDRETRGKIHTRQPVIDVSKKNDWSAVRFMNTLGTFGRVYPAHGFIYPDSPSQSAQQRAAQHTAENRTR